MQPRPPNPKAVLRANQRALKGSQRDLDKEIAALDRQEKQIVAEIKKMTRLGNNTGARTMAKELVRLRNQRQRLLQMKIKISAVSSQITTVAASNTMATAAMGAARAMNTVNNQVSIPQLQQTMQEFEKQNAMMEMKEEVMSDALDDDEDLDETDDVLAQVSDELGLELAGQLAAPSKAPLPQQPAPVLTSKDDADIERMLRQLTAK